MNILCKDEIVLRACLKRAWHPVLIDVYVWLVKRYEGKILVTEAYRESRNASDVHATDPIRAFDIRSINFEDPKYIAEEINRSWIYDPKRPDMKVALLHDVGLGIHFHIQVHPNTIFEGI